MISSPEVSGVGTRFPMGDKGDGEVGGLLLREGPPSEDNLALVGDKAVFSRSLNDEHGLEVNGH